MNIYITKKLLVLFDTYLYKIGSNVYIAGRLIFFLMNIRQKLRHVDLILERYRICIYQRQGLQNWLI